jgi:peptidyl-prolyl cis-trans isomerase SurA
MTYKQPSLRTVDRRSHKALAAITTVCVIAVPLCSDGWAESSKKKVSKVAHETAAPSAPVEVVLDAVVASVDEKPITLSELGNRLTPPRKLSLQELRTDAEAQKALDALTFERVLEAEATTKRISVVDAEVDEYINEVAARNSLSRSEFEAVLAKEGKSVTWYKRQIRTDILRTKLASTIVRGGISVSDGEIDEYLSNHPTFKSEGATVKLRVITISPEGRTTDDMAARVKSVQDALESGTPFTEVATKMSDSSNSSDGGLLGVVAEKDLSSDIFDAIMSLEAGKHSAPVVSDKGTQIFFVEQRFGSQDGEHDEDAAKAAMREEARATIQKQKSEQKLAAYFSTELLQAHSVDKKF